MTRWTVYPVSGAGARPQTLPDRHKSVRWPCVVPVPKVLQVPLQVVEEEVLDRGQELRLVVLHGDDAVAAAGDDRLDDLLLAAHRVDRDRRAGQLDLPQELRDGRDLIALGVGGDLPQRDPLLGGPGADDVQGAEALRPVVRPATGLAVDGDQTCESVGVGQDRIADPGLETALERPGLQGHEQPTDAAARGDAVGQGEVLGQPRRPMLGPAMDGGGPVASAGDAADRDDDDIGQEVLAIARVPRIGERFEVRADGADVNEPGHGNHPGSSPWGPWRRTATGSDPGTGIGTKISARASSRQTTQTAQLYARAVGRGPAVLQRTFTTFTTAGGIRLRRC